MAGTTSKLALYLPGGGLSGLITPDEQVDIDKINDNMKKIDTAAGVTMCTSGTRPSTPFTGQPIYETDTRRGLIWNGSSWVVSDGGAVVYQVATTGTLPSSGMFAGDLAVVASNKGIYSYNGTSWRSASGLIPIRASGGGGGGGGSAVQNASGKWFITNCTFVNVDGVFSGEFDNYVMVLSIFASSVATLVSFVFRAASVDTNSSYAYGTQDINFAAGTTSSGYSASATNIPLARSNGASGGELRADIAHPWRGNAKYIIAHGIDSGIKREIAGTQQSATFFDGFTLNAGTATFSGEMTIFGVTNPF